MQKDIRDFQKGERIEGFYLIKTLNLKTSSNNSKYFDLIIADSSGEIDSKIWSIDDSQVDLYKQGDIIKLRGDVTEWMDRLQLKIIKHRNIEEGDEIDYCDIVPSAPRNEKEMLAELEENLRAITNQQMRELSMKAFELYKDKLLYYPAAMRHHHAIRGGLLFHLLRMMETAKALCKIYDANEDLLITGIFFHDLQKIEEMEANELGIVSGYSKEGILLGHLVQGVREVRKLGSELGTSEEILLLIEHMILSHHYHPEFGSPKRPMFLEAELLHHIDMIDARVYDMKKATRDLQPGEFSEPIFALDRIRVYLPELE
ncbi:MAG: HD domain-containing protein [Tissierellia bacterium]|nr:HD domain-containing protein [Bacillota bacterium]NLL22771.1 HD domain-containing protein [Tissierellia bacterium]